MTFSRMGMRGRSFKKSRRKIQVETGLEEAKLMNKHDSDGKSLSDAARRALSEAEERRKAMDARPPMPPEIDGRDGPEPIRYGDWERKGIAVDF